MPSGSLRGTFLVLGSLLYLLGAGEVLCRFTDGYAFNSLALTKRPAEPAASSDNRDAERALLEETRIDKSIDPNLFFTPPVTFEKPVKPELEERTASNPKLLGQENYLWNDALLRDVPAHMQTTFRELTSPTLFAFPSYDGTPFPRFRLHPDARTNLGTTNRFGWLSPDISLDKPDNTVRVGILGDSTSHNTYALHLQGFLQAWAARRHSELRFEVLNTARQGAALEDNINILKYELLPASPDYVILTQAPNVLFGGRYLWKAAPGVDTSAPPSALSAGERAAQAALAGPARWSALARHLLAMAGNRLPDSVEREPRKPHVELVPPLDMTKAPSLQEARSSFYFNLFLDKLDEYKETSRENGAVPIITTERACAHPGMAPNRLANPYLFETVNGATYWPLTYKQIQHILLFDNAVIQTWASTSDVPVIDLERLLPKDPTLCSDVMHDGVLSQRLRAWLIFQSLAPRIETDLANKRIPRPPTALDKERRAALLRPFFTLDREKVVAGFKPAPTQ